MIKKFGLILITLFLMCMFINCNAAENSIILNTPVTNDTNHTFKYPNLQISNNVNPYSITLSIENGYFNTSNATLNTNISNYFVFRGGTNTTNAYITSLNTTEKYKLISFNLKDTVDLTNASVKTNVINSIKNFLSDITFYNNENKDAKFVLTFSEVALSFSNTENNLNDISVVAFKDPSQNKEHYYAKIESASITWSDAYNIATSLRWNNLQGYLVTITSEAEHNFIYQSLGSIKGWMGAAAIENYDSITYNTKNIVWDAANDKLGSTVDNIAKNYWRWVAGPEAGRQVFANGAYTKFTNSEPNNFNGNEWCGEYGHSGGGAWNDFPNSIEEIQGFYVEFGGFDSDNETVKPVSLTSTFKWADYDFRIVEDDIKEKVNSIEYTSKTSEEELKNAVESVIKESGVKNTTSKIINKKVVDNKLSYDIEITIGINDAKQVYTIHVEKDLKTELVNFSKKTIDNPNTLDIFDNYKLIGLASLVFILFIALKSSKR